MANILGLLKDKNANFDNFGLTHQNFIKIFLKFKDSISKINKIFKSFDEHKKMQILNVSSFPKLYGTKPKV